MLRLLKRLVHLPYKVVRTRDLLGEWLWCIYVRCTLGTGLEAVEMCTRFCIHYVVLLSAGVVVLFESTTSIPTEAPDYVVYSSELSTEITPCRQVWIIMFMSRKTCNSAMHETRNYNGTIWLLFSMFGLSSFR